MYLMYLTAIRVVSVRPYCAEGPVEDPANLPVACFAQVKVFTHGALVTLAHDGGRARRALDRRSVVVF